MCVFKGPFILSPEVLPKVFFKKKLSTLAQKGGLIVFEKIKILSTFHIRDSSHSPKETSKILGEHTFAGSGDVHCD